MTELRQAFLHTRAESLRFCEPLVADDYCLQAEPFTSPPKWHLAHTTWFFETFILKPYVPGYRPDNDLYEVLFNSYYNGVGEQHPRPRRGLLSRPTVDEVRHYRERVDAAVVLLLEQDDHDDKDAIVERVVLGIEHERQHQELFFTDLKYSLAQNPMHPAYSDATSAAIGQTPDQHWQRFEGGLVEQGYSGSDFCFDNELPRHRYYLEPFELANRLVTNAEFQAFIDDAGYQRPELWLADGWTVVQEQHWQAPLYWRDNNGQAMEFTLHGLQPRQPHAPACHLSGYEADAYARWADARLPTEQEWEVAAQQASGPDVSNRNSCYHPQPASGDNGLQQLYDACWQWTQSAYSAYPGYRPAPGAIGEYNGKFMSNQWVLRGGSCVSVQQQLRASYRNFFYPVDRWQFSGLRLARSLQPE